MAKFRKKPVVVSSIEVSSIRSWHAVGGDMPKWVVDAINIRRMYFQGSTLHVGTTEGVMTADDDGWIIRGVEGEIYPCSKSVFEATYDPV